MKVKELISLLKKLPQDAIVLLSSDDDGNSYSPLDIGYGAGNFDKEKGTVVDPANFIYTMNKEDMHGDYIILYPQ